MLKFYETHCEKFQESYRKTEQFFRRRESRITALKIFGKVSTVIVYSVYIILLGYLAFTLDSRIIRAIAVPAAVFLVTTAVRSRINAPRPYEKYPLTPLVYKSTKGKSCPSRHSACAFAIAFACLYVNVPAGIVMLAISAAIAASRPIMGVHFPLDAVFGSALAAVISVIGFILIP